MRRGRRPGGGGRRTAGAVLALTLGALVLGPPAPVYAVDCTPASTLTNDGYPQRAIAYVDGVNVGFTQDANKECRDQRAIAVAKVESAEAKALEAERLAADVSELDGDEATAKKQDAKDTAKASLGLDRENARATAFFNTETSSPDSWWQTLAKGWERFTKTTLTPLGTVAVPAAILFAALLAAARIWTAAAAWNGRTSADQATRRLRWSWIVTAVASAGLVGIMSGLWPAVTGPARWVLVVALAAVAGVGVWNAAWGMARRLRIVVAVRNAGADDSAKSAHVLALLEQFGASPPKGIERPAGPDVNALENVLSEAGTGWLATLKSGLATLFGWTPWRVTVDYTKEPDVIVTITRNGRSAGVAVITPAMQKIGDTKIDPANYVAAFVLVTLARAHRGFEGLCGASHWRGLGLQYTAAALPGEQAKPLLIEALHADPASWLTKVDHENCQWRESADLGDLVAYGQWLSKAIDDIGKEITTVNAPRDAYAPLLIRIKLTRAAVCINTVFADVTDPPKPRDAAREPAAVQAHALATYTQDAAILGAKEAIIDLCLELGRVQPTGTYRRAESWLHVFKSRAAAMASTIEEAELARLLGTSPSVSADAVRAWGRLPRSPEASYSWACAAATPGLRVPTDGVDAVLKNVMAELRRACVDSWVVDGLRDDPQMAWFRATPGYREFRPKPQPDLLALKPYAAVRLALNRLGLTSAPLVASIEPDTLAAQLGIAEPAADQLVKAARLHATLAAYPGVKALAVNAVDHLLGAGLADVDRIRALDDHRRAKLASDLATATSDFVDVSSAALEKHFLGWITTLAA